MSADRPPLCRKCHYPHWATEPHLWIMPPSQARHEPNHESAGVRQPGEGGRQERDSPPEDRLDEVLAPAADDGDIATSESSQATQPKKPYVRDKAKYNAYQNGYQKDKRAAKKLGIPTAEYRKRKESGA